LRTLTTASALAAALLIAAPLAHAAGLSGDARAAIPHDVQQLIVVDYRAMQNSPAAMDLKDRVMPPELKRLETALINSGLKVDSDADALAFAAFRAPNPDGKGADVDRIVGIAQGQFHTREILANFAKTKTKPVGPAQQQHLPHGLQRPRRRLPQPDHHGLRRQRRSPRSARRPRRLRPQLPHRPDLFNDMVAVDSHAIWSLLDTKGTQTMMKSVLGVASQLADYDTVKNRMKGSRYTMDFNNGVRFDMAVNMSDTFTAATVRHPAQRRPDPAQDPGHRLRESRPRRHHHRLHRRHSHRRLLLLRQPVRQPPHLAPLPIRRQVIVDIGCPILRWFYRRGWGIARMRDRLHPFHQPGCPIHRARDGWDVNHPRAQASA
jgi:hypothetical protein